MSLAVDLDQPVDRLLLQLRRMVLVAVPAGIGGDVGKPEVGGEVDHLGLRRLAEQILDHLLRGGVRQRAEGEIEACLLPVDGVDRHQRRQRERRKLRKDRRHLLPGPTVGGEQRKLGARMAQQQPYQLGAGIAGRPEHADLRFLLDRFGHGSILPEIGLDRTRDIAAEDIRRRAADLIRRHERRSGAIAGPCRDGTAAENSLPFDRRHGRAPIAAPRIFVNPMT